MNLIFYHLPPRTSSRKDGMSSYWNLCHGTQPQAKWQHYDSQGSNFKAHPQQSINMDTLYPFCLYCYLIQNPWHVFLDRYHLYFPRQSTSDSRAKQHEYGDIYVGQHDIIHQASICHARYLKSSAFPCYYIIVASLYSVHLLRTYLRTFVSSVQTISYPNQSSCHSTRCVYQPVIDPSLSKPVTTNR